MTPPGSPPAPCCGSGRRAAVLVLLLLAAGAAAWTALRPASRERPDIAMIVWDTCRADRTSLDGYALPTTPRLQDLAAGGVHYPFCFTPSPWTPPSHASLFTGLLPLHHGLREGLGDKLHPDLPLLAGVLREAGYETVAASANPLLLATGLLRGFETILPVVPPGREKGAGGEVVAALDRFLEERAARPGPRRPLFLFVNLMDCHLPLDPPREDLLAVHGEAGAAAVPAGGPGVTEIDALSHLLGIRKRTPEELRVLSLAYDGGVHAADRATGSILDLLRREGLYERAVVAVVGDHGESLGEHGDLEHRMSIHDAVLRVPLVVRWPGRLDGGRVEEAQVRTQDLYPTLLEAAGVPAPPGCGTDATTLTETPLRPRDAVAQLLWIHSYLGSLRTRFPGAPDSAFDRFFLSRFAVREATRGPSPRKLVVVRRFLPPDGVRDESEALFDLRADPGEERSLLGPGEKPGDRAAAGALRERYEAMIE